MGGSMWGEGYSPQPIRRYYLLWRIKPSHPWHSEEFDNRTAAHRRYFALIERGIEAYLERRPAP